MSYLSQEQFVLLVVVWLCIVRYCQCRSNHSADSNTPYFHML